MEVRRWKVIDIYYKKSEKAKAEKLADKYPYHTREDYEGCDEWEGSIQLISVSKITEQ